MLLMQLIGRELGRMHQADIIHGDLTTSNMLVRCTTTSTSDISADPEIVSSRPSPSPRQATNSPGGSFDRSFDRSSLTLGSRFNRPWWRIKPWISTCSSGRLHRPTQCRSRSLPRYWTHMGGNWVPRHGRASGGDSKKVALFMLNVKACD